MSDIASEIAAEHAFGMFECQCGHPVADWDHLTTREMRELHTAHIVRVTEAAVRARIAADIRALRCVRADCGDRADCVALTHAAWIAEGGTS